MAKIVKGLESLSTVLICEYCANLSFKQIEDFIRHLRDLHCSREGGSFVCLYGYNGVCTSLPVEGVSDKDYVAHATKHAIMQQQRKSNGQLSEPSSSWTVYSAAQNLPAVLNDPFKGKQSNFLTRTWGDGFVEKVDIPKSPYLPEITMQHFESYLKKIARVGTSEIQSIISSRKIKTYGYSTPKSTNDTIVVIYARLCCSIRSHCYNPRNTFTGIEWNT